MVHLFIIIEIIAIFMLFVALGLLLYGDGSREQKLMGYFLCGSLIQNAGYLLELMAPSMEAAITATKMEYLGSLFIPVCYCWFLYGYCYEKAPERLLKLLLVIDICMLVVIFTCDQHDFYYRSLEWRTTVGGHPYLSIKYGPGYLIFLVFGCALPYALSIFALIRAIVTRSDHSSNKTYKLIAALSICPIVALLSYAWKLTLVFDLTPAVLGLTLSSVMILIWSRRNYDFYHLAAGVVLNSMGDGVISLDNRKRIIGYNQAAAGLFTKLGSHMIGDSIEYLGDFPEDMLDEEVKKEFSFNGRYYESHAKRIIDKNGKAQGYVLLILDVTETRNYIEEIKSVREQAEKANMAKSEFLANMSHEIRTPMNAIMGLSDIIMEESHGQRVYTYACDIKSASQNLLTIINDILDLSKVEAGKMELVATDYYVKEIVDEVVGMMDMAASQHGLLMKCQYDTTIPCRYHGDEGRIKQILINLLNNAVKFTEEGYVKLSVGGRPGAGEDQELLVFQVEDTGCGIRQEDLEKIFEEFKQVDSRRNRSVEGTGLGLSITRRLLKLMDGTIEVESIYGEGTIFTVTVPQRIVDRRTLAEVPEVPVKNVGKTEVFTVDDYKVLVVDDNLINRKVAMGFLKNYGFELEEAASGPEAIELVKKSVYPIIFMDHMMPKMDGIETVRIIREECGENGKSPVIIALTANAMEGVKEKFLENGFQDFITKPLDRKDLNMVLDKWIPDSYKNRKQATASKGKAQDGGFEGVYIEGIDMEKAKRHHSGDTADYRELLELYCLDGRRKLPLLKELLEKKDYRAYEIEVHGLKSASANVGAMRVSALSKEHEEAAARGEEGYIAAHFMELSSAYENQLRSIQTFLNGDQGDAEEREGEVSGISQEELVQETREALISLEKFRSKQCAEKVEGLLAHHLEDEVREKLKEIHKQLKLYEDDAAEALLGELLEMLEKEE